MITPHSAPWLNDDDLDSPTMAATKIGHDHIPPLIREQEALLLQHARLHQFGQEATVAHLKVMLAIEECGQDLARAWAAPWN